MAHRPKKKSAPQTRAYTCSTCPHMERLETSSICRFSPPQMQPNDGAGYWPRVNPTRDFCGMHPDRYAANSLIVHDAMVVMEKRAGLHTATETHVAMKGAGDDARIPDDAQIGGA